MNVLETSPAFVPRKRNVGACAPPWGRGRPEPLSGSSTVRCSVSPPRKFSGLAARLYPPGGSQIERMVSGSRHELKRLPVKSPPGRGVSTFFIKPPSGFPCEIEITKRTDSPDLGILEILLHNTTENRLKLLALYKTDQQFDIRTCGYWRARLVADEKGSPNMRPNRRRLPFTDPPTNASVHSDHGPPGCIEQQLPITGTIQIS